MSRMVRLLLLYVRPNSCKCTNIGILLKQKSRHKYAFNNIVKPLQPRGVPSGLPLKTFQFIHTLYSLLRQMPTKYALFSI